MVEELRAMKLKEATIEDTSITAYFIYARLCKPICEKPLTLLRGFFLQIEYFLFSEACPQHVHRNTFITYWLLGLTIQATDRHTYFDYRLFRALETT